MLTPSNLKPHRYPYDFSLRDGEMKEQFSTVGNYIIRAIRTGNTVEIYKQFATGKPYKNKQISYDSYLAELRKPMNHGSLIEAF